MQEGTRLFFYDSISPIVEADSIDMSRVYMAARYDKGTADYINCPIHARRIRPLLRRADLRAIRRRPRMGEAELLRKLSAHRRDRPPRPRHLALRPHEARRLARSAHRPDALRRRPTAPGKSARRLLQPRRIPESPEVRRSGPRAAARSPASRTRASCATARSTATPTSTLPTLLTETLQMKQHPNVLFAGQISGVEGYVESIATGLMAGMHAAALANETSATPPPRAIGIRLARSTTSLTPTRATSSPRTSPSICCPHGSRRSATKKSAIVFSASARCASSKRWMEQQFTTETQRHRESTVRTSNQLGLRIFNVNSCAGELPA